MTKAAATQRLTRLTTREAAERGNITFILRKRAIGGAVPTRRYSSPALLAIVGGSAHQRRNAACQHRIAATHPEGPAVYMQHAQRNLRPLSYKKTNAFLICVSAEGHACPIRRCEVEAMWWAEIQRTYGYLRHFQFTLRGGWCDDSTQIYDWVTRACRIEASPSLRLAYV